MSPVQEAAFTAASGGQTSSALLLAVAAILCTFGLVWLAWLGLRLFDRWSRRRSDTGHLLWHLVRAIVVVSVLGWFVR